MEKIAAQVRSAEVRGAMAAFIDAGLVKVASKDAFEELCSVVADNLGEDYDLQKVAAVTEAVLGGGQEEQEKTAAEKHDRAVKAALGDLFMQKTAGQIDDDAFTQQAAELLKMAGMKDQLLKKLVGAKDVVIDAAKAAPAKAKDLAETAALKGMYAADGAKSLGHKAIEGFKGLPKPAIGAIVGATAGGVGTAAGLGARALYDKYNAE